ncbi:MAG: tripartite tricarboxylate transporter TctB family protein [Armatimonadota bacterium]|nr:tripartite tricarboxylate transporter TctB family protein [Armatimonadota bacterium]MDR7452739.1 tripartite tricarboxylate transporter TctB family protein [Armatimonadota bacterium]MDR7468281.1 tripartite tricarboxylate transporter TctB family protein [Armatimonadota bacterium]MDR7495034.1 tripartite tricarboxylate transporter TctB family protein [Armatimonadota bacterium]MDR7500470.1 tripartite tricarboxylate transporter TctB family protein [Armatimonadota bacterium]
MAAERGPAARPLRQGGRSDRLAALIIFGISALYVRYALTFQPPRFRSEALGPATFPLMIGGLMLACSAWLFFQSFRPSDAHRPTWAGYLTAAALWGLLLGYVLLFDRLGFPLSTALFLAAALRLLEIRPWWKVTLYTVIFTAGLYYAFSALDVRLPPGEWLRR